MASHRNIITKNPIIGRDERQVQGRNKLDFSRLLHTLKQMADSEQSFMADSNNSKVQ